MIWFQFAKKKNRCWTDVSYGEKSVEEYKPIERNLFRSSCWRAVAMVYIIMIGYFSEVA